MLRVLIYQDKLHTNFTCRIFCPGCHKQYTIQALSVTINVQIIQKCSTCGAELPVLATLLKWKDVRVRYHKKKPVVECERIA